MKMVIDFKGKVVVSTDAIHILQAFIPIKVGYGDEISPDKDRIFDVKVLPDSAVKLGRTDQLESLEKTVEDLEKRNSEEFNRRYKMEQKVRELEAKLAASVKV